jgi:hypothetical protein
VEGALSGQIEELGNKLIERVTRKNWKLTSMDISRNLRRNCKKGMLTRNNWKPLRVQIKELKNKFSGKDSDSVT